MTDNVKNLVNNNVYINVSQLINSIFNGGYSAEGDLYSLYEQALDLVRPVKDYESAAIDEGWEDVETEGFPPLTQFENQTDNMRWAANGWKGLCEDLDIEPYEHEPMEFWAVSGYLADALTERGEKVEKDFAGMNIWARCTSGQVIEADSVIRDIAG